MSGIRGLKILKAAPAVNNTSLLVKTMPSNPNRPLRECRQSIDLTLQRGLKKVGSLSYKDLVRESLLHFDVSQRFVEKFINEFYIDEGKVIIKDGVLYPTKEEVQK
jgi:hypothetical protein